MKVKDNLGIISVVFFWVVVIGGFFACNMSEKKEKAQSELEERKDSLDSDEANKSEIGKYVYISTKPPCLHVSQYCCNLLTMGESSSNYNKAAVHRIKVDELTMDNFYFTCAECVNDEVYEELIQIIRNGGNSKDLSSVFDESSQ